MAITLKPKHNVMSIPSLGKEKIIVEVEGATKPEEKKLSWKAARGIVDGSGNYTAPRAQQSDEVDTVTVTSVADKNATTSITINIEAEVDYKDFIRFGEMKPIGENGMYHLHVQCTNHFGFGSKCSVIITDFNQNLPSIFPPACSEPGKLQIARWTDHLIRVKTSSKGFVSLPIERFTEPVRKLHVRIKGTRIDRVVIMRGPKPKIQFDINAGFWGNIKNNF